MDVPGNQTIIPAAGTGNLELRVTGIATRTDDADFPANHVFPDLKISCDPNLAAASTVTIHLYQSNTGGASVTISCSGRLSLNPHFSAHRIN